MTSSARLDTVRRLATPEGCVIDLRLAGPVVRARAWLIDFLIRLAVWLLLVLVASRLGDFGAGLVLLAAFLLEWLYPIAFEVWFHGQTPGKKACGLAVVHDDGRPLGGNAAFIRNSLRAIDFLPLLYATGFVSSLLNADGKRLGDLAAGTLVVHVESGRRPVVSGSIEVGSEPPPCALSREEQLVLIEFSQRAPRLTPERAAELAAAAGPLFAGVDGEERVLRLRRIGNFLFGNREG